nr:unnamed protein product [Spirometra erinaceieuropaei]
MPRKSTASIWGPDPKRNRVDATELSISADNLESSKSLAKQDDSANVKFDLISRNRKPSPFRFVSTGHGRVEGQVAPTNTFICKSPAEFGGFKLQHYGTSLFTLSGSR